VLVTTILCGPDIERDGGVEWTLPMLCRWIEGRFDKRLHPASLSRVVRSLDVSRLEGPAMTSASERGGQGSLRKRGAR
jgi:hypothetical protein